MLITDHAAALRQLARDTRDELVVVSPWVRWSGVDVLLAELTDDVALQLWFRWPADEADIRLLDPRALRRLYARPDTELYAVLGAYEPSSDSHAGLLHAKLWLSDGQAGVLTSANLTGWGLAGNREVGTKLDRSDVRALEEIISEWPRRRVTDRILDQLEALKASHLVPTRPPAVPHPPKTNYTVFAQRALATAGLEPRHIPSGLGREAFEVQFHGRTLRVKVHCSQADDRDDFHFEVSRKDHAHFQAGRLDALCYLPVHRLTGDELASAPGQPVVIVLTREVLYGRGGLHQTAFRRGSEKKRKVSYRPASFDLHLYNRSRERAKLPATFPLGALADSGGVVEVLAASRPPARTSA